MAIRPPAVWLLALAGACVSVWLAALIAEHHMQGLLVHLFEQRTQRSIRIAGGLEGHLLSAQPTVVARDVDISNPPWSGPGSLGHVGRVGILLEWHFAWLPLEIRRLELDKSEWHLRRDAHNRANWTATEGGADRGPRSSAACRWRGPGWTSTTRGYISSQRCVSARDGVPAPHDRCGWRRQAT